MGTFPPVLAAELRDTLGIERAIETGTYYGGGARALGELFPIVLSIELSAELHRGAREQLADMPGVTLLLGDSRTVLADLVDPQLATLYWLDGHWSGGPTAGAGAECPILDELAAIAAGHPDDCILIDDARLFAAPPPPPHDPDHWPTLVELFDALRSDGSERHVTMVKDLIIAVPLHAKPVVDAYAQSALRPDEDETRRRRKRRRLFGRS